MSDREMTPFRSARCECGHTVTDRDTGRIAASMRRHIREVHPDMRVPPQDRIRHEIHKARAMFKGTAIFLLYPKEDTKDPQ